MTVYLTPFVDDPVVKLNEVLSHFPAWGVNVVSLTFVDGQYTLTLDAELDADQIEHLALEVINA